MILGEVTLDAIDIEDESFRISEDLDPAAMDLSLQAVGLINPVMLLECTAPSGYRIVCGFRRLRALRRLGGSRFAARILRPDELSTLEVFLRALWDNLAHRRLCPLETARVLFTLRHQCAVDGDLLVAQFLPILGLSAHRNVLQGYLVLHQLHPELRRLLSAGHLTMSSAERLARTTPAIQAGSAGLLQKIRLSASLQREVLDLSEDLAAVTRTTMPDVLNQLEIRSIADDPCLSAFQKGEKIHRFLYRQRNPRISRAHETFQAEKEGLNLPGTIRLSPDPFFESPRLRVEFDAASAKAFRETVEALGRACRTSSLEHLFKIS